MGELILLAAGGHDYDKALYDQPTEKMMAQIQAAANVALEFPNEYPTFYQFITESNVSGKTISDKAEAVIAPAGAEPPPKSDPVTWRIGMEQLRSAQIQRRNPTAATDATDGNAQRQTADEAGKARSRVNNLVARKLDTFQNETRYMWDRLNQMIASALSGVIIWFALSQSDKWAGDYSSSIVLLKFVLALVGGIAAPFAKDLVTGLSSFAKKA